MITIKIVSDVSCPWCVIGYYSLLYAIDALPQSEQIEITWKPFELNPHMPAEGQDRSEHIQQKYGLSKEQSEANRANLVNRGKEVGYDFNFAAQGRIYNTFDAHRLLHWAASEGKQTELKLALFDLYFQQEGDPSREQDLLRCVAEAGLNQESARKTLNSTEYSSEVRADEEWNHQHGISAVPAFILNNKYLISGAQPPQTFSELLQKVLLEESPQATENHST